MRRLVLCGISPEAEGRAAKQALAVCVLAAAVSILCGCASQRIEIREWYEPTESTVFKREDGMTVGALKSETIKSGQPDWSNKTFSLFSW